MAIAKAAASAGLVVGGYPGGFLGLAPAQLGAVGEAGGHLLAAAVRAITGRKPGEIPPQEYQLATDPARELPRRVAAAVRAIAERRQLVVFLDTGGWGGLRRVMSRSGPRVAWVIGARFEAEAETGAAGPIGQFRRDLGDENLALMSPGRFDEAMIRSYLRARPDPRDYPDAQVGLIAAFTKGLPLAVSLTAPLLDQGQRVEDACRQMGDGRPSSVIADLARSYLAHAEKQAERQTQPGADPARDDVTKILGLALAFGDLRDDPEMLAALWDAEDPLPELTSLARRHDFVLPASKALHEDVRDTLRVDLLDPYQRRKTRRINEWALALLRVRLGRMRDRWPGLDDQITHASYTGALLAALWHTFWLDNQNGLDLLARVLPVLAVADPAAGSAAVSAAAQFAGTFYPDQRRDLEMLAAYFAASRGCARRGPLVRARRGQGERVHAVPDCRDGSHRIVRPGPAR